MKQYREPTILYAKLDGHPGFVRVPCQTAHYYVGELRGHIDLNCTVDSDCKAMMKFAMDSASRLIFGREEPRGERWLFAGWCIQELSYWLNGKVSYRIRLDGKPVRLQEDRAP